MLPSSEKVSVAGNVSADYYLSKWKCGRSNSSRQNWIVNEILKIQKCWGDLWGGKCCFVYFRLFLSPAAVNTSGF